MTNQLDELIGDVVAPNPDPADDNAPLPEVEQEPTEPTEPSKEGPQGEPEPVQSPARDAGTPQSVPLPVYMDLKHELRDLKHELRSVKASQQRPDQDRDPIDVYLEKVDGDEGTPIPAGVYKQYENWKAKQSAVSAEDTLRSGQEKAFEHAAAITMSDAALGSGLGLETVTAIGAKYLSERDKALIRDADPQQFVREYYTRCVERILKSGTPDAKLLLQRIQAARGTPSTPPKQENTEVPGREEILQTPCINKLGLTEQA